MNNTHHKSFYAAFSCYAIFDSRKRFGRDINIEVPICMYFFVVPVLTVLYKFVCHLHSVVLPYSKYEYFLQVSNNGVLSLNLSYASYTPVAFPFLSSSPLIAPFLADVDTTVSNSGNVTYRATTEATLLAKAAHDIPPVLAGPDFIPVWLFIATWDHVGYFSGHFDKVRMLTHACA